MANNRIYYAIQQVNISPDSPFSAGNETVIHGLQSIGMTTNFSLKQVFELGEVAIYQNVEGVPNIEVTLSKVLDGAPPIYLLVSKAATTPTLVGRTILKCVMGLSIYDEAGQSAGDTSVNAGAAVSQVQCSGMYLTSVGYTFPIDGNCTESVSLAGNDKIWKADSRITNTVALTRANALNYTGAFANNNDVPTGLGGVNWRRHLKFVRDASDTIYDVCLLPTEIQGISSSGTNEQNTDGTYKAHIQSMSTKADIKREDLYELGRMGVYTKTVTYPIEVSCDIELISTSGDRISAVEDGILNVSSAKCAVTGNLSDQKIRIATCEGTRIYLGDNNKLSSVNYTGGDAGGGNVKTTFAYKTFNDFTVMHQYDTNASGTGWWTSSKATYLNG